MNAHDPNRADAADIRYCFRLILGREPHPEELPGHNLRIGDNLADVVTGYLRSLEFGNRRLLERESSQSLELAQFPSVKLWADHDDLDVGRHLFGGNYEPNVTEAFCEHLSDGMSVLDVGANVGYFSMLSASLVGPKGSVLAIEPNPKKARMIEASRRTNDFAQVRILQCAAGAEAGMLTLHASHSNGITNALPAEIDALLASETVAQMPIDAVLDGKKIDLIKLDVEGAEYKALLGASGMLAASRPIIISEFCPPALSGISGIDGQAYIDWIIARGYAVRALDGGSEKATKDSGVIMRAFADSKTDHIDIVALPDR